MKLEGKWYVTILDEKQTGAFPNATEIEIFEGSPWIRFKAADGKIRVTSFPAYLRPGSPEEK